MRTVGSNGLKPSTPLGNFSPAAMPPKTMRHSGRYESAAIPVCERTWLNDDGNRASILHCGQNIICIINVGSA
jgi:hypothetical protein